MKKLFILLLLPLLVACSSDDDNDLEQTQDYTSFVVTIDASPIFTNCIAAYKKDNKYYKIAELGDLTKDKYSDEVKLTDNSITDIYIFSDYNNVNRFDAVYTLVKNKKNNIIVKNGTKGIRVTDKTDPTQYPQ